MKLRNSYISVYTIKICYNFGVHYLYVKKKGYLCTKVFR